MIDPKSLRCGNLVLDKLGRECKILELRSDHYITSLSNGSKLKYHYHTSNPIPLTDDVLIWAGFVKSEKWNYFSKTWGQFGCVLVKYQPVHEKFCVTNSTNAFSNWIPCEHLHTLQNAWHLFTEGTELEINHEENI